MDEPRWLTDDEQQAWRPFAALMFKLPSALDAQLQRDAQITHFDYMVLISLSEAPGRSLRMSDLADMAAGSLSRLSHVVSRLERRGWVRREPCPGDGRYINAVLTDQGLAKVVSTAPGHVETVRKLIVDALTPEELRTLGAISTQLLERLLTLSPPNGSSPPPQRLPSASLTSPHLAAAMAPKQAPRRQRRRQRCRDAAAAMPPPP